MTFSEALDGMKRGKVLARRSWVEAFGGLWGVSAEKGCRLRYVDDFGFAGCQVYAPTQADIFATDWEVQDIKHPDTK